MLTPYIHTDADRRAEFVSEVEAELERLERSLLCEATILLHGKRAYIERGKELEWSVQLGDTNYFDPRKDIAEQLIELLDGWIDRVRNL